MSWVARVAALVVVVLSLFVSPGAAAETLEDLDRIVTKAKDMNEFLARPELLDEYYESAQKYYGGTERFPRQSFDAIVAQMRTVSEKLPDFGARAWESAGLGAPFTVTSETADYGVRLNDAAWKTALARRADAAKADAGALADLEPGSLKREVKGIWDSLREKERKGLAAIEAVSGPRREKDVKRAALFAELRADPSVKTATAALLHHYLRTAEGKRLMGSGSPEIVLDTFHRLNEKPALILEALGVAEPPGLVLSVMRQTTLPTAKQLLAESPDAFPPRLVKAKDGRLVPADAGRAASYVFKPIPRRIHSFFKGVHSDECVGGGPTYKLEDLSPERWATGVLKDSQMHYVEVNGRYDGFVHQIPLTAVEGTGHRTVASVDLAAPTFRNRIVVRGKDGRLENVSLFSAWFRHASAAKPKDWTGFAVGDSNAIVNGGAISAMRLSPEFMLSGERWGHDQFKHYDPMAAQIPGVIPLQGNGLVYGGQMIFEGGVKSVKTLTILKPSDRSAADWIRERIAAGDKPAVASWLDSLYWGSWDPAQTNRTVEMVIQLRDAGVLQLLRDNGIVRRNREKELTLADGVDRLRQAGFTWEEMGAARVLTIPFTATEIDFLEKMLPHVKTAEEFMALVKIHYENPDASFVKLFGEFWGKHAEKFAALKPSFAQYNELLNRHSAHLTWPQWYVLQWGRLGATKNAAEYLQATDWKYDESMGRDMANYLNEIFKGQADHFIKLKPSATALWSQLNRARLAQNKCGGSGEGVTKLQEAFRDRLGAELVAAATPADYVKLVEHHSHLANDVTTHAVIRAIEVTHGSRDLKGDDSRRFQQALDKIRLAHADLPESLWISLFDSRLAHAHSGQEIHDALNFSWEKSGAGFVAAAKAAYARHADAIESAKFTDAEFAKVIDVVRLGFIDGPTAERLIRAHLKNAATAEEYLARMTYAKPLGEHAAFNDALKNAVHDTLPHVTGLTKDAALLNKVLLAGNTNKIVFGMQDLHLAQMKHTPQNLIWIFGHPFEKPSSEFVKESLARIERHLPEFLEGKPTFAELLGMKRVARDAGVVQRLTEWGFARVKTARDFIANFESGHRDETTAKVLDAFLDAHWENFMALGPTADDLKALRKAAWAVKPELDVKIAETLAARAASATDLLDAVDTERWAEPAISRAHVDLFKKYFARLRELKPSEAQVQRIRRVLGGVSYAWGCWLGFKGMAGPTQAAAGP